MLEEHHDGHGEEAVDLAGNGGEFTARVVAALQLDGDENVRFQEAGLNGGVGKERGFATEFLVGELKKQIGGLPLGNKGSGLIKGMAGPEEIDESLRRGASAGDELVALVAELGEELAGGVLEREGLETGEGGFHEGYFRHRFFQSTVWG